MKLKYAISAMLILLLSGCGSVNNEEQRSGSIKPTNTTVNYGNLDVSEEFNTLEQLTDTADLVVEVKLTGEELQKIEYEGANFTLTNATVKEVIKGDTNTKSVKIFEVASFNINLTKRNDKFLLFLNKYTGPVTTEEAYSITGVYQGKFGLDANDKIVYDAGEYNGDVTFQNEVQNIDVIEFKKSIQEKSENDIKDVVKN